VSDFPRIPRPSAGGLALQPGNAKAHKDLAYTLLKTGDNPKARDQFKQALDLDPKDETAALEFAFLAYETKQPIAARRTFDKLRHSANPATAKTARRLSKTSTSRSPTASPDGKKHCVAPQFGGWPNRISSGRLSTMIVSASK
jgi:tetratricopeptide (TPR) repeat protein